MPETTGTELIPSVSIEGILQKRADILSRFDQIYINAKEMHGLLSTFSDIGAPDICWKVSGQYATDFVDAYRDNHEKQRKDFAKAIDKIAWRYLMKTTGNLELMDAKAKDDWRKSLDAGEFPELTNDNIKATLLDLHNKRGEMFHRGIIRAFEGLSWDYKTNQPFKLGKKIIVGYMSGYYPNCGGPKLTDLERVFRILDGEPELADYSRTIEGQARGTFGKTYPYWIETEYMKIKIFGNDNGHVEFLRPDLVQELNRIIALYYPFHIPQDNNAPKKGVVTPESEAV